MCKCNILSSVLSVFHAEIFVGISHDTSVKPAGIMCNQCPQSHAEIQASFLMIILWFLCIFLKLDSLDIQYINDCAVLRKH